jgi:replicative DNA helicase
MTDSTQHNGTTENGQSPNGQPQRMNVDDREEPSYPLEKMSGRQNGRSSRSGPKTARVPPHSLEVERAVLGAALLDNEVIPTAIDVLDGVDEPFYARKNAILWDVICTLFNRGEAADMVTVHTEIERRGEADRVSQYYVSECTAEVASTANVEVHAHILAEHALKRCLARDAGTIHHKAYEPETDAFELLEEAESAIFGAGQSLASGRAESSGDLVDSTLEHLESIHGSPDGLTGIPSGFGRLDDLTAGWQDMDLIVIAARPSMGKTSFALANALNASMHRKRPTGVGIFSLEMGGRQLMQRLLTSQARVDAQKARTGRMSDDEWQRLSRAAGKLSKAEIFIDDTPGLSPMQLRAKARRMKAEHDIGLILVDYLQLMQSSGPNINTREQEIAHISRSLKGLAKELDLPVIALSQLNRKCEQRNPPRPKMSDLRASGAIEQDADVVAFIYRAERYDITTDENGNSTEGIAEILVEKQRNGPTGKVHLSFVEQFARFENLSVIGDEDAPF